MIYCWSVANKLDNVMSVASTVTVGMSHCPLFQLLLPFCRRQIRWPVVDKFDKCPLSSEHQKVCLYINHTATRRLIVLGIYYLENIHYTENIVIRHCCDFFQIYFCEPSGKIYYSSRLHLDVFKYNQICSSHHLH